MHTLYWTDCTVVVFIDDGALYDVVASLQLNLIAAAFNRETHVFHFVYCTYNLPLVVLIR